MLRLNPIFLQFCTFSPFSKIDFWILLAKISNSFLPFCPLLLSPETNRNFLIGVPKLKKASTQLENCILLNAKIEIQKNFFRAETERVLKNDVSLQIVALLCRKGEVDVCVCIVRWGFGGFWCLVSRWGRFGSSTTRSGKPSITDCSIATVHKAPAPITPIHDLGCAFTLVNPLMKNLTSITKNHLLQKRVL